MSLGLYVKGDSNIDKNARRHYPCPCLSMSKVIRMWMTMPDDT